MFQNKAQYPKVMLLLAFTIAFTSCGKRSVESESNPISSSIIIGELGWKEIASLPSNHIIRIASSPVADIDLPAMDSRCTGFLISEDVLMTNQHCIPSASYARGVTAIFNHQKGVSKSSQKKYDCSTFIGNYKKYDFALLKCAGYPGRKYGYVELDSSVMQSGSSIFVVQQNCDYYSNRNCDFTKKYSVGNITNVDDKYTHNADTLGGSSGSPVFSSETGNVVAIHNAGYGNNGRGRGVENYAVPMSKIVDHILTNFPAVDLGGSSSGGAGDYPAQDPDEPNNTKSGATILNGSKLLSRKAEISTSSDVDYYKITAPKGSAVTVSIKFNTDAGDLDMKVLSSKGVVVGKSAGTSSSESVVTKSTSDTMFFMIYGYKGAMTKYDLSFSVVKKKKNNNTIDGATELSFPYYSSSKSIASSEDKDYYSFTIEDNSKVDVSISFSHAKGDLELYLLNVSGKIISKSTSTKNNETVTKYLKAGKYYVKVFGYKGATGKYSMNIQ